MIGAFIQLNTDSRIEAVKRQRTVITSCVVRASQRRTPEKIAAFADTYQHDRTAGRSVNAGGAKSRGSGHASVIGDGLVGRIAAIREIDWLDRHLKALES